MLQFFDYLSQKVDYHSEDDSSVVENRFIFIHRFYQSVIDLVRFR